ncbi:MAG TPA: TfoX/Sxy family protein [Acidimicrobiia bacterium]|nr:TfoX/Sxy family protein [Acidimicrobiia bacterium]
MKMPKPSNAARELFQRLLPEAPDVTQRPMFGQLAGFVNGNMFLCLFGDRIAVKLSGPKADELMAIKGAGPFVPMEGRPMKGYVVLPLDWHGNSDLADYWVEQSLAYVRTLPPKLPKKKK